MTVPWSRSQTDAPYFYFPTRPKNNNEAPQSGTEITNILHCKVYMFRAHASIPYVCKHRVFRVYGLSMNVFMNPDPLLPCAIILVLAECHEGFHNIEMITY